MSTTIQYKNFIGGEWVEASQKAPNLNPSNTQDVIGEFPHASRADAERAMRKAAAEEAEAQASDETSDKAKSAAQDDEAPPDSGLRPVPKLSEPERGLPPRTGDDRFRQMPPRYRPESRDDDKDKKKKEKDKDDDKEKKKRGKNG